MSWMDAALALGISVLCQRPAGQFACEFGPLSEVWNRVEVSNISQASQVDFAEAGWTRASSCQQKGDQQ